MNAVKKGFGLAAVGGVSLLALAMAAPLAGVAQHSVMADRGAAQRPVSLSSVSLFTPAVRNPRLAAALARQAGAGAMELTPAVASRQLQPDRAIRVAVRARPDVEMPMRARPSMPGATLVEADPGVAILPTTYNLGAALTLNRFALTGDIAGSRGGGTVGSRDSTSVGAEYRATRRLTARMSVTAERAEGAQRVVNDDRAVSLDVAGSYSIARGIDVTGGVRYRVARDRLEPLQRDDRRDSQALYLGTAIRF